MRINNNIMALNAHRQLGANQMNAAKSMEKLSSGFRINRAGDDAAGLAISEKMRGQIRGLTQASRNAQDGISLIQTAEGALNETHSILQRMRELAVQSATDTNTPADRAEIQKEIDQLSTEITRISTDTEFNTQTLLDGNFGSIFHIGANQGQNVDLAINAMDADALSVSGKISEGQDITGLGDGVKVYSRTMDDVTIEFTEATSDDEKTSVEITPFVEAEGDGDATPPTITVTFAKGATAKEALDALKSKAGDLGLVVEIDKDKFDGSAAAASHENKLEDFAADANAEAGINVSSQQFADQAITTINDALETVSAERSKLGAMQNRLEHTIANLGTSAENLQAAESRIRDLDMAEEIMAFTRNNILQQAATAMLAQANMAPQSVLQLLG
jgi:flagellin